MPRNASDYTIKSINMSVSEFHDSLTEADRAILFNKLLKYEGYSPRSVNLEKAELFVERVRQARGVV